MRLHTPLVFAVAGAICLSAVAYAMALEGAGPYKNRLDVQVGLVVGMLLAYFVALLIIVEVGIQASRIRPRGGFFVMLVVGAAVAFTSLLLSPGLAYLLIAVTCQSQLLCPQAANPISWSFIALALPKTFGLWFPFTLLVTAVGQFLHWALLSRRENEA